MSLVQSYLDKHRLQPILEGMVNITVKKRLEEPLAYLSEQLGSLAAARVAGASLSCRLARDGSHTFEVCVTTRMGQYRASVAPGVAEEDVEAVVAAAASACVGMDPTDQAACDSALMEAIGDVSGEEGKGKRIAGYAMSTCLCRAAAGDAKVALAEHVAKLLAADGASGDTAGDGDYPLNPNNDPPPQPLSAPWIPVPSVAVFEQPGNALPFTGMRFLASGAATLSEAEELSTAVCKTLSDSLSADKACAPWVAKGPGALGGFLPVAPSPLEPSKLLAMIQNAVKSANAEGKVAIALDVGGQNLMVPAPPPPEEDADPLPHSYNLHALGDAKAKPNPKSIEEFSTLLEGLSKTFGIAHLGEPFAAEDRGEGQASALLKEKSECPAQVAYAARSPSEAEALTAAGNAVMIPLDELPNVTAALEVARWARDNGRPVAITCTPHAGQERDAFPVDFASGIRAGQLYLGPTVGDFVGLWNGLRSLSASLGEGAEYAGERAIFHKGEEQAEIISEAEA